jgi:hypothetical protein
MSWRQPLCFNYWGLAIPEANQFLVDEPSPEDLLGAHPVINCGVLSEQERDIHHKLDRILEVLSQLTWLLAKESALTMAALDDLTTQVKANTDAEASAITLIQGLADALKAAGTDPAKLAALQTQLLTSQTALAAAIVANTPAAPPATTP